MTDVQCGFLGSNRWRLRTITNFSGKGCQLVCFFLLGELSFWGGHVEFAIGDRQSDLVLDKARAQHSLRAGALAEAYEFLEFVVFVQTIEIRVFGRPIWVAVSGRKGFF